MNIDFNADQREIAKVAASLLAKALPTARLRELAADQGACAIDDATWVSCAELGWLGVGVPEEFGGVGLGVTDEAALFVELGRYLAPGPFLATAAAAWACVVAGDATTAAALVAGKRRAGLVVTEFVLDAAPGDLALLFAAEGRVTLRELSSVEPCVSIDPATRLGRPGYGPTVVEVTDPLLLPRAQVLVAAMELGVADAVRDMSVKYAKTRHQFGVPIGSFQAVKHRCSDMTIRAYAAEGQLAYALHRVERRADDAPFHGAAALLVATNAAERNAADNVQNHGAIGFTQEHDAGLYSRRAHVLGQLLGGHAVAGREVLNVGRHTFENPPAPPDDWWAAGHREPTARAAR